MKLFIVKRKVFTDKSTIGELWLDGVKLCDTLEDKARGAGEAKIFGETAIPAGRYALIMSFSNRFKEYMPEVLNVPGFLGIRWHVGNSDVDTLGCLLLGTYNPKIKKNWISASKVAVAKVYAIIKKYEKKEKMYVEYIDER